jgi:hypothetical protein
MATFVHHEPGHGISTRNCENKAPRESSNDPLPSPLVGVEVDLRGLPFMPLETVDLFNSDFFAMSSGDEFKAGIALMCRSWSQRPAASLPNGDHMLAYLSGAGKSWRRVRTMALRDWILCSDGRLYHPAIAKNAQKAWEGRLRQRTRANARWKQDAYTGDSAARHATVCPAAVQVQVEGTVNSNNHTGAGSGFRLIFPEQLSSDLRAEVEKLLFKFDLSNDQAQSLLDELEGAMIVGKVRNPVGYARKLAESIVHGSFIKEKAFKAVEARLHRVRQAAREQSEHDDREKAEHRRRELGEPNGYTAFRQMKEELLRRRDLHPDPNLNRNDMSPLDSKGPA